jgi:hypothetical protein
VPVLAGLQVGLDQLLAHRDSYERLQTSAQLGRELLVLLLLALWAGGWALVGRLLTQRARFIAHWSIACLVVIGEAAREQLLMLAQFLVPAIAPVELASLAGQELLIGVLLFAHLTVLGVIRLRARALAAACISGAVVLAGALSQRQQHDWVSVLPYWSTLRPLGPSWLPRESPAVFFREARALRAELERLAREQP